MPFVPFIKTPLTDITGVLATSQGFGNCRAIEMKMINCLEAHGMERGLKTCTDLVEDFKECFGKDKQWARVQEMDQERLRQKKEGKESYIEPPRFDAYKKVE